MKYPKITVITPSFNQACFLEKTIKSVIDQKYPNLEYFIIDGGSTDNSIDIIKKYEKNISFWCSVKDNGQASAINKGFKMATGEIICWLNSDDLYEEVTFRKVANYFNKNQNVDIVYGDLKVIDSEDRLLTIKRVIPYCFISQLFSASLVPQPSCFWKTHVFKKIGYLNEKYNYQMDYEYFVRMGAQKFKFGIIKEPLAKFRLHPNSKTNLEYNRSFFSAQYEIQKMYLPKYFFSLNTLILLKHIFKFINYIIRIIYRGDFIPNRFKNIQKKYIA